MGADVADRVDDFGAEQRRRQPRIHRARHAVLADHQAVDRRAERLLQHLDRLDVIDAEHLPFGGAGRRADRGGGGDEGVVGHFIHAHQLGMADGDSGGAEHAAMIGPAAAAGRKHRAAADRGLDILQSQNAAH